MSSTKWLLTTQILTTTGNQICVHNSIYLSNPSTSLITDMTNTTQGKPTPGRLTQQPRHTTKSQGSMATRSRTDSKITDQSSRTDKGWPEKDITETTAVNTGTNFQQKDY